MWYSIAAYMALPWVIFRLIWRGLRYPAYFGRWRERFGYTQPLTGKRVIWVHAVSVGEVKTSVGLVEELLVKYPRHQVMITTMTPTGSSQVTKIFGDRVAHSYVPYDLPHAVRRFLDRVHPEFAIIAETEFWPNIFRICDERDIPLLLVNVRVSQTSMKGYLRFPRFTREMLRRACVMGVQSQIDAQRLRNMGAPDRLVGVTGNLKFDVELPPQVEQSAAELRAQWGANRPIWIAASTHDGEERKVLAAFRKLRQAFPDMLLVVVPRHPERFASVARLCSRSGYSVALRSEHQGELGSGVDVLVGDTMGELQLFYAAADVAYIGGSLVARGGQNVLESAAVGVPVVFGPHMFNFEQISAMTLERGAGRQVHDVDELTEAVSQLFQQPGLRRAMGEAGRAMVAENRGALHDTVQLVQSALQRRVQEGAARQPRELPRSERA
jgi:3-deoxy-D-manno-octulosonic-acid transferase